MYNDQLKKLTLDSSKPTKYRCMATLLDIDDCGHVVNFNQAVSDHASMFGINIASSLPLAREVLEAVHGLELVKAAASKPVSGGGSTCESGARWVMESTFPECAGFMQAVSIGDKNENEDIEAKGGETFIYSDIKIKTPNGVRKLYYFK